MIYTYGHLEDYIDNLLRDIHIYHPWQLTLDNVCHQLHKKVHYIPHTSMCIEGEIFLREGSTDQQLWQDFAHELCHARLHDGDQALMAAMQKEYQEFKAENFAQHFCIPTRMLHNMSFSQYEQDPIWRLQETFGVDREFAEKRWEQYTRKLIYG